MKLDNVGTVIAERELEGQDNGKPCKVIVKFGKPFADEAEGSCWYCPYSITTPRGERVFYGAGLDSVQALRIAMSMVGSELLTLYEDLEVKWTGQDDLGFGS